MDATHSNKSPCGTLPPQPSAPCLLPYTGEGLERSQVVDGQLVALLPSLHTAATALAPALQYRTLLSCGFHGQPVAAEILQHLPSSLRRLRLTRRAFNSKVNLAALSTLAALELPDLQPDDTLPPSLRTLVLRGHRLKAVSLEPILHLTGLKTLELQTCLPQVGQLARLRTAYLCCSPCTSPWDLLLRLVCPSPCFPSLTSKCLQ